MFVVCELQGFPEDAQPFQNNDQLQQTVSQRGLALNESMCSSCPPIPPPMQLPHIFSHVYAGMEMLHCGQEEWQMCQIVRAFVKENAKELGHDTASYFEAVSDNKSVSRYVYSLSRNFQPPDALQTYLFARACNAHTRVHFANCVWSTVDEVCSYYVALDISVIGNNFVPLCSLDQETIECVVGEVRILWEPQDVPDEDSGGEASDVEMEHVVDVLGPEYDPGAFGWDSDTCASESEECVTRVCSVKLDCLSPGTCVQLSSKMNVLVEWLPRSALNPTFVFKAAQRNKSDMFPGKIFHGQRDWTKCTVAADKPSISSKMPGYVFNATGKQKPQRNKSDMFPGKIFRGQRDWTKCTVAAEKPSISSKLPGFVFTGTGKQKPQSSSVPAHLDVQLTVKCVVPSQVDAKVSQCAVCMFNCLVCTDFVHKSKAAVK